MQTLEWETQDYENDACAIDFEVQIVILLFLDTHTRN